MMKKIRYLLILLGVLSCSVAHAEVNVSIGIGLPGASIGINLPAYPDFVVVPGYPVYYAPRLEANLFFYDGLYWAYQDDNWYASSWYNGPWWYVYPEDVPLFILRVPVRYYRRPPVYFIGWYQDSPPRWGNHWGHDWERNRHGWDRWNRSTAPAPAPLPLYQRQYSGDRYPRQVEQQHELNQQHYRYQPHDPVVQRRYQEQLAPRAQQARPAAPNVQSQPNEGVPVPRSAPASQQQRRPELQYQKPLPNSELDQREQQIQREPAQRERFRQDVQRSTSPQADVLAAPRTESPPKGGEVHRSVPASPQQGGREIQDYRQSPQPESGSREQQRSRQRNREDGQQGNNDARDPSQGQGQQRGRDRYESTH